MEDSKEFKENINKFISDLGSVKFNDDKILDKDDNKTSANELVGKFLSILFER